MHHIYLDTTSQHLFGCNLLEISKQIPLGYRQAYTLPGGRMQTSPGLRNQCQIETSEAGEPLMLSCFPPYVAWIISKVTKVLGISHQALEHGGKQHATQQRFILMSISTFCQSSVKVNRQLQLQHLPRLMSERKPIFVVIKCRPLASILLTAAATVNFELGNAFLLIKISVFELLQAMQDPHSE